MTDPDPVKPRISFLGVPVFGDFEEGNLRAEQFPLEQFQPIVKALLAHPDFLAARWTQYTPYFDDGDTCVFSARRPGFLLRGEENELDDFDSYDHSLGKHSDLGRYPMVPNENPEPGDNRFWVPGPYEGPDEERYRIFEAFSDALECGHFDDVLIEAFGDHAEILLTADRIDVDSYHHD